MSDLRQAAQQALEALEGFVYHGIGPNSGPALASLRAALAQPEPAAPTGHSEQWWLHRIDMEKTAAWQQGYAQGLHRASKSAAPTVVETDPMEGTAHKELGPPRPLVYATPPRAEQPLPNHDNHHNALKCPYCNPRRLELTAPRSPLTPEQISAHLPRDGYINTLDLAVTFARAIEAAHGIRGPPNE